MRRFHYALTITWALLAIPTMLWWRDSVAWLTWISLYANVASHLAAWQAARIIGRRRPMWLHGSLAVAWLALSAPTLLWWQHSVAAVILFSVYANLSGHWAAAVAACAEEQLP